MFADSCENLRQHAADRAGAVLQRYPDQFFGKEASHAQPSDSSDSKWDDSLSQGLRVGDLTLYPLGFHRVTAYHNQEVVSILNLFPDHGRQWIAAGNPFGIRPRFDSQVTQRLS
jgi:hypothetical protein